MSAQNFSVSKEPHNMCRSKHFTQICYCPVKAGHSTTRVIKRQENTMLCKTKFGTGRKPECSERLSSPRFISILVFESVPGTNSGFCLLFTILVLKTSKTGLGKTAHYIKWKTLIRLSVSEATLAIRRERTALSNATRIGLPKPSKKILY